MWVRLFSEGETILISSALDDQKIRDLRQNPAASYGQPIRTVATTFYRW